MTISYDNRSNKDNGFDLYAEFVKKHLSSAPVPIDIDCSKKSDYLPLEKSGTEITPEQFRQLEAEIKNISHGRLTITIRNYELVGYVVEKSEKFC